MIVQSGCVVSEYGWEAKVPQRPSDSTETVLCVSFDHGAQRLFSSVCISLCCKDSVRARTVLDEWQFAPGPLSPSVTNRDSSAPLENEFAGPNPSSLPTFHAIFEIEQLTIESDIWDELTSGRGGDGHLPSGQLTLKEGFRRARERVFEVSQPLTADTQNVSVSFTSSPLLYTSRACDGGHLLDGSTTVGRVVRVQPIVLPRNHKAILLPTEVLLMIFANISDTSEVYKRWRRDLFSCALVCKQWICALNLLLSDFHYPYAQKRQMYGYPPEICSFADALALRPSRGLSITHLSPDYFVEHPSWRNFCRKHTSFRFRLGQSRPSMMQRELRARLELFIASFLSILRLAKNLRSLSLSSYWTADLPNDFRDALRGLGNLEAVDVTGGFNTVHQTYLAMWPSLKRLTMVVSDLDELIEPVPTSPPEYVLIEAALSGAVKDEHLNYVLSSSSSSLECLLIHGPFLTNTGLHSALEGVSKSLVTLQIMHGVSLRGEHEEHALDSLIVHMDHLENLLITPDVATHLMIERRADAFERSRALGSHVALPVIDLTLDLTEYPQNSGRGLVAAAARVWPGWKIKINEPAAWFAEAYASGVVVL